MQKITVDGVTIALPSALRPVEPDPDAPDEIKFTTRTHEARAFVTIEGVEPLDDAMLDYTDPEGTVDAIHEWIATGSVPDAGLLDIAYGPTHEGDDFIYAVFKRRREDGSVWYMAIFNMAFGESVVDITIRASQFDNIGKREDLAHKLGILNRIIGPNDEGWEHDPYDADFDYGVLMNFSETQQFDRTFPEHALTLIRQIGDSIASLN